MVKHQLEKQSFALYFMLANNVKWALSLKPKWKILALDHKTLCDVLSTVENPIKYIHNWYMLP